MSLKPTPTITECIEAWTVLPRACRAPTSAGNEEEIYVLCFRLDYGE